MDFQKFINSALTLKNHFNDIEEIKKWVKIQNLKTKVNVNSISFSELEQWGFNNNFNNLAHKSGKFFSIDGIRVNTNWGNINSWDQPIINQPEIGYLGIIAKEFDGVLHFLLQAKIEPGNVNCVQLSPTLQATKSNYTQVHKGNPPNYLEYFLNVNRNQILVDQLQSEQGSRFLKKRNRNIIIEISDNIEILDNFIWLTLAQIKKLMSEDNLINMDTRTVVSCIPYSNYNYNNLMLNTIDNDLLNKSVFLRSYFNNKSSLHSFESLIHFITNRKCLYTLDVNIIPLCDLQDWLIEDDVIRHFENKYFKVIASKVEIENREVVSWCQPMIMPTQEGICAFICKNINGVIHFIVQTKLESGNFDILELAPTVQCLTGGYKNNIDIVSVPFLSYILNCTSDQIVFDSMQSEEGGRFYKEQNRNMLIFADDNFDELLPDNYIWMTLFQMQSFIAFNNYLNIQARSLLAAIPFI
jgi:oxidase EvaA